MWWQFFSQNFHFVVNLFTFLVLMAMAWLYLDAWLGHHSRKELFKWVGFGLLSLSFLAQSTLIEQSVLGGSLFGSFSGGLITGLRLSGYLLAIIGHILDPLQQVPKNTGLNLEAVVGEQEPAEAEQPSKAEVGAGAAASHESQPADPRKAFSFLSIGSLTAKWLLPVGGLAVAGLYWRRATTGLERHLKRVAWGFLFIGLSDLIGLASLLRNTDNPTLYSWVAAFGWVWLCAQIALLIGALILGRWVWSYLTKRFFSQLFMVLTVTTVIVFFVVTISFTSLLLRNIRSDALTNLGTAANVLNYALSSKQAETMAGAQQLAADSDVVRALQAADHDKLAALTKNYLVDKKQTGLIITDQSGKVLLRGQDTTQWGDSLSGDSLVRRALLGTSNSSVSAYQGVGAPTVQVRSAATVYAADGSVVGSVVTELELGSAFVDGIKQATGLQSSVYSGNVLAATTVLSADGKTRSTGIKLSNKAITDTVLTNGKTYSGALSLQNRDILGVFLPLKDVDNANLGMLMVSEPQSTILRTAGRSIELTFLLTAVFLLVSMVPIYIVTRLIEKQLD